MSASLRRSIRRNFDQLRNAAQLPFARKSAARLRDPESWCNACLISRPIKLPISRRSAASSKGLAAKAIRGEVMAKFKGPSPGHRAMRAAGVRGRTSFNFEIIGSFLSRCLAP